ncbi:glycerol-3-phosphate dehydrogenase C-terminal domain-containing protein [Leucobacter insecticola]|uniref:glycerol-3-phosphate dehydrogenase C-terminal domain-containing protein n=1 Tax=Leucobacter insecticola TaxID=2714934 RepID=UPI001FCB5B57|nr:glycerol-3-phosphate dehydrogenase C-terminal domain-containing protein [Leucobacter insecticola]
MNQSAAGFINVLGGKLTTYRRMAEDAVDLAVRACGLRVGGSTVPPSRTAGLRIVAADDARATASRSDAAEPVAPGVPVTRAEVEYAVRVEGALTVEDVLDRRTRIGLVDADRAAAEPIVSEIVAETLAE